MTAALTDDRLLAAAPGPIPWRGSAGRLIEQVAVAGLTGRGGAGFPTARKLAAVARLAARGPVVVANGAEGEPASAKDRTLLSRNPHLVLDGLQLAAEAVGASRAYAYVGPDSVRDVERALAERGGRDRLHVTVVPAPRAFLAGEESAVTAAIEGRPALPRDTPLRVVTAGVRGAPTLVQNVETLAHLALVARHGPDWFRRRGTPEEPGTFLATVSGAVSAPGVYEFPCGVPLSAVLTGSPRPQAVLVGGYHGGWVPGSAVDVPITRAALSPFGAAPGAGVIMALPQGACGLVESARIATYLAGSGAGQCGPCRLGLPDLAGALTALAVGPVRADLLPRVERLASLVAGRGACRHPDGTARFVASTLRTFAAEVGLHLNGRCSAR